MLILDACVVTALLTGHRSSETIAARMREDPDLAPPAHLHVGVLSALRGRMLGKHLTMSELRLAAARLAAMPVQRIPLADTRLLLEAVRWFHNLSAYDACYAALARELDATLLTGDKGLADSATRQHLDCHHIDCSA